MGMAASQARYLELTARKNNVEYQGQQINQQRTELANESAGLFSQLMGLQVPTAPNSTDYTKTQYTFSNGENSCTLGNVATINNDPQYNANVTYSYNYTQYTGIQSIRTDIGARQVTGSWWLTDGATGGTAKNLTSLTQCSTSASNAATQLQELNQICLSNSTSDIATALGWNGTTINTALIGNAYYYQVNGVDNYLSNTALAAMPVNGSAASLAGYYASNLTSSKTVTERAYVQKAQGSDRYTQITLASTPNTPFAVTTTSTTDQNAYNDAMNEYTYKQMQYQQQVTSINAKTCIIQNEDKELELQLRQLDTEQQALSTEMDSVKKVIDKNIESTFKTFSS